MNTPTPLSIKRYFEPVCLSSLNADDPVDTGVTWTILDNVMHWADSAFPYRINYVDPIGFPFQANIHTSLGLAHVDLLIRARMPVTLSGRKEFYPNYEICVGLHTPITSPGVDTTVTTSIVTAGTYPGKHLTTGVLGVAQTEVLATSPSYKTTPYWIVQSLQFNDASRTRCPPKYTTLPTVPGTPDMPVGRMTVVDLCVEIKMRRPSSAGLFAAALKGLQVREYLTG